MFNTELKKRFLKDAVPNNNIRKNYTSLFNITEVFEKREGVDLCALSPATLQEMVNSFEGTSVSAKSNKVTCIKKYCEWCLNNGIITELTWRRDNIKYYENKHNHNTVIKNPIHLQKCLDMIFDKENDDTIHNIYRCYLWFAYMGIRESDTVTITNDNINLMDRVITIDAHKYAIYEQAIVPIKKCMQLTEFNYNHPNYSGGKRERSPGNELLRGAGKNGVDLQVIRSELSRRMRRVRMSNSNIPIISYAKVIAYGIFYRTWQEEIADGAPDIESGISDLIYAKDLKNSREVIRRSFKKDYKYWKDAVT